MMWANASHENWWHRRPACGDQPGRHAQARHLCHRWCAMRNARRGFTLLEVMVAIGLILALSGGMWSLMSALGERRERLGLETTRSAGVAALFDQIENDLTTCVAADAEFGAGVKGDAESLTIVSRGVGLASAAAMSDARSTNYVFAGDSLTVSRKERGDAGASAPMLERIGRVRFRYFDGQEWTASFDSGAAEKLPVALEVAVWFDVPPVIAERRAAESQAEDAAASGTDVRADNATEFGAAASDDASRAGVGDDADAAAVDEEEQDWGPAGRVRIFIVPDGPVSAEKRAVG
jgi:prepilin-type N-terminal cleavage/methylation domain-containing protein